MAVLSKDKLTLIEALFKRNKVKSAYTFGSLNTPAFNNESDIDFLIAFNDDTNPVERGENWFSLYYSLKQILNREVDLVREEDIKNPYLLQSINASKMKIYG
jgi:uncharacterized protein